MRKLIFIVLLSLLLTACEQEKDSVIEAFKSEGIKITKIDDPTNSMVLNGTKPTSFYIIDNGKQMWVYVFDSKEKQELGLKDFKKQRMAYNTFDPPVYQTNKHLVIILYGGVTLEERIQKAVNRIK
jgi:hypothetical protein